MIDNFEDEGENIEIEIDDFNLNLDEKDEEIDKNIDNTSKNPEENLKKKIRNIIIEIDINEYSDDLADKSMKIYNQLEFNKQLNGIDLLKKIFEEVAKFSKLNLNKRISDFFDFILVETGLKFENITKAINITNDDLDKENNRDIIYFWKEKIIEEYLKAFNIKIESSMAKDTMKLLLQYNYSISEIKIIFSIFKPIINNENYSQYEIIKSLLSILISYPNEKNIENLQEFIKKYYFPIKKEINEDGKELNSSLILDKKVALDYYLNISSNESDSPVLSIKEIFHQMKINNPGISDIIIQKREIQLQIIDSIINDPKYQNFEKIHFKEWTKKEFPLLKFDDENFDKSTSIVLGMISLVIKKTKLYHLRNTQLIAILMFIGKENKYGLIEEISTGEGKSCIICSLAIYFSLRMHKVDIISSSYTLAVRDSEEFKNIYDYFNLTTGFPYNSESEPYSVDILYGTFFEFEGDYLRELTSNRKIRKKRPFDVIIIDEVDNLFIDNILSSTRLTNSSRGFKFLIPLYLSNYLSFELFDFFFLLFFKLSLEDIKDKEKRLKFENLIKYPKERKKEIINMLNNLFDIIFNNNNNEEKGEENQKINEEENRIILSEEEQKKVEEGIIQTEKNLNTINQSNFIKNFLENLDFPEFLENFVKTQSPFWISSAYDAKNIMNEDRDYVITLKGKNKDIAPVDRTNTGEIETSMVYSEGLHQMLQIKHLLRIKDETLVHTFLSHITFFQKYKNDKNFLFFGLTGTIGDPETQKIYKNKYFNSKLLFIPQYKKKRFVELPAILCDIKDHYKSICDDIIVNYSIGRKVLVICNSIKEANILKEKLKSYKIQLKNSEISHLTDNEIVLYTRSDTNEKENINVQRDKRIFLSTNLGGRGTDLRTNEEEEKKGGLHVILTDMPSNYRVLKQAFGRTSREGKKGTGQMILKNTGYNSYSEIKEEMNKEENERILKIQSKLDVILFKDKLFEDFCQIAKDVDFNSYLIDDINERWAYFLQENIKNCTDDNFNKKEITKKFNIFIDDIKKLLVKEKDYEKFRNPFFKMQEGLRKYHNYSKELKDYFTIDVKKLKFYFVQPYISSVIEITNADSYSEELLNNIINNLNDSKNRIKLLTEKSIKPFLDSFENWGDLIKNFNFGINEDDEIFKEMEKPLIYQDYRDSPLYKQYDNIKNILAKISDRIDENINTIEKYKKSHLNDKYSKIFIVEEELEEGLSLKEDEMDELGFFADATFNYVYEFSIRRKLELLESKFWKLNKWGYWVFLIGFCLNPILGGIIGTSLTIANVILLKKGYDQYKDVEITENTIFANVLKLIIRVFSGKKKTDKKEHLHQENVQPDNNINLARRSKKISLFNKILENIENEFTIIKDLDILKFLIFVDNYVSEGIWNKTIKEIILKNFKNIYEKKFNENKNIFKTQITEQNFKEQLDNYNKIFKIFIYECCKDIKKLGDKKKYDEKTGLNCLEHLIINLNSEKITEEISNETVKHMLKFGFITEEGIINEKLFEDCFSKKNPKQLFKININTKIDDKKKIININNLKEFKVSGFEIPMVDPFFNDLKMFYRRNKYYINEQLEKDYSLYIINNFKNLIKNMLSMNDVIFKSFYNGKLNLIKNLVKNLLEEKIFSKYNQRSIEREITSNLTDEEKLEFKNMIEKAGQSAYKAIKDH